jgi:ribosomal protein L37E
VTFRIRKKAVTFRAVPHLRCSRCGERLFDRAANRVIDAQRPRKKRARRLEDDPRFLRRIAKARADIAAGRGLRLEDIDR